MNAVEKDFIELTRRAINCEYADDGFFDETNWEEVFELACRNSLAAVLFDAAKSCKSLPEEIRKKWDVYKFQTFMRQTAHFQSLVEVVNGLKDAGIDYAVFKGQAISECYPKPSYRSSCDSDILVSDADRVRATQVLEANGYEFYSGKKDKELSYVNQKTGHTIELHTSVFEDYEGAKIDILSKANLNGTEHRIEFDVNGKTIRTMGVDEHLVYQMFHMIKHFMLEGASVKFFTDITLFVNKNIERIHPDFFWKWMDKCNYSAFCENFFAICIEKFGMDSAVMKGHKAKASAEVLDRLLVDFIYVGDKEKRRESSWQLTATMQPYFVGERNTVSKSKSGRLLNFLFPKASELNENYEYAKKIPLLLPIAWVHRVVHKIIWQVSGKGKDCYTGMQKVDIVESKLGLLGSVGLLDEE